MRKLILILLLLTPFVFDSQKAFAGAGQSIVAAPAPIVSVPMQRAVTANGDTVAIREIVKEKDSCEQCECYCEYYVLIVFAVCPILLFIVIVLVLRRMAPRY